MFYLQSYDFFYKLPRTTFPEKEYVCGCLFVPKDLVNNKNLLCRDYSYLFPSLALLILPLKISITTKPTGYFTWVKLYIVSRVYSRCIIILFKPCNSIMLFFSQHPLSSIKFKIPKKPGLRSLKKLLSLMIAQENAKCWKMKRESNPILKTR